VFIANVYCSKCCLAAHYACSLGLIVFTTYFARMSDCVSNGCFRVNAMVCFIAAAIE